MLGSIPAGDRTIVADLEAGIGTLTRLPTGAVDAVIIVVEPTPKSVGVGQRALEVARDRGVDRVVVVANRLRSDEDLRTVTAAFDGVEVVEVPDDPAIVEADRLGVAPLDHAPEGPAVLALQRLAARITLR